MLHARSTDKFSITAPQRSGSAKGKRLIAVNRKFHGDIDRITLQDLLNFLHKHDIDPLEVSIPPHYSVMV